MAVSVPAAASVLETRFGPGPNEAALARCWADRSRRASLDEDEELASLCSLIKGDLRARFERGETPAVAGYLSAFPELLQADSRMISLIYEEYCLLEERGEAIDAESFCGRYPDWKDSLASQLRYHQLLSKAAGLPAPKPPFPEPGDEFEEFALGPMIGQGGYSHVFVANDQSLGGKRVVLKVSVDRGQEAETQGALDHPHIVPVNSVVYQPDNGLRGLSMPFRLGTPLDEGIRRIRERAGADPPRSARVFWDALVEGIDHKLLNARDDELDQVIADGPEGDGWRGFPRDGSFARGAAWIGLILANALEYAHRRETFHRDVKPANVLLTLQHGPQLLDFNLAHSPHSPQEAAAALGGTLPYMAPEQIEAFLVPERWAEVGAVADVYSLGLVLHELLTGRPPELPAAGTPPSQAMRELLERRATMSTDVRIHNPRIPHALEAIVKKCLRPDPKDRYRSSKELAEDLDDFLHRRRLRHASNPSRIERCVDWSIRNRRVLIANVFYLCILGLISPVLARQAVRWFEPGLRQRPAFRQAVQAVDGEDYNLAVELLLKLVEMDPKEPLLRFYLGIALSHANRLPEDPAIVSYGRAAALPDADAEIRTWAKEHAPFVQQLRWFGAVNLDKTREMVNQIHPPNGEPAPPSDPSIEKSIHRIVELADHALRAALDIDPTSTEARLNRATIAEYQHDFETARARLTDLLGTSQEKNAGVRASQFSTWRMQRARVAMLRARELISSKTERDPRRALELIDESVADLDNCARAVLDYQRLFYYSIRTETLITRGEVHSALGKDRFAEADYKESKQALERWLELARSSGNPVPDAIERSYHDRLQKLHALASALIPDEPPPPLKPQPPKSNE